MKYTIVAILLSATVMLCAQTPLTIEGQRYSNAEDTWYGVNIARSQPTTLVFRNNSITSINRYGYLLSAGDEVPGIYNNNLDGAIISGNLLTWNGNPEPGIIPHGIFTGYNINVKVKYNYLNRVPMAIIRKSDGMTDVSGAVAYNILKDPGVGVVVKGMNGVKIYNNTFYSSLTASQTNRALIEVYENPSVTPAGSATGTKIFNNLFYTKNNIRNISISAASRTDFESDYNVFYCEAGTPLFAVDGAVKTFAEWQAMGYDRHSVVVNPGFKDLINFAPSKRLDYGTDLGTVWAEGLSVNAKWGTTTPATSIQNGAWQVGAVVYEEPASSEPAPANLPPSITISSPTKSNAFTAPANVTIDASANDTDGSVVKVEFFNGSVKLGERTSAPWSFSWKDVPEGTYNITAAATDNSNARTVSAVVTVVVEKASQTINQLPEVTILTPVSNDWFETRAKIILTAAASDPDGSISKVEYLAGSIKLGESYSPPFYFSFECDTAGTFELTAVAYDNLNASAISAPVTFFLKLRQDYPDLANLYPTPNNGEFTVEINTGTEIDGETGLLILGMTGNSVYSGFLSPGETSRNISISDAVPGIYILRVTAGGRILTTKRFIKY